MRKNLMVVTAIVAAFLCACTQNGNKEGVISTDIPEASHEVVAETMAPEQSYIFKMSTGKYYEDEGTLVELVGNCQSGKSVEGKKRIGTISRKEVIISFYDHYYEREITLQWKGNKGLYTLTTKDKDNVFRSYGKLKRVGDLLFNVSGHYEAQDGQLVYVDDEGNVTEIGASVTIKNGKWKIEKLNDFNLEARKDKKGRTFYEGDYVMIS